MIDFSQLIFRKAEEKDLTRIVEMLASDILGKDRENLKNFSAYQKAFQEIFSDKNHFLAVIEYKKAVIGTCHLTVIPSLTSQGSKRMNVEAVRVDDKFMNQGIGSWMMQEAIKFAKDKQVKTLQLTSNKVRQDAHRFYQKLGFSSTHEGMKLPL